jgi:RES domain-containing protein
MLEVLVHMEVDYDDLPDDYVFQVIDAPDPVVETVRLDDLKPGDVLVSKSECRAYGSCWLAEQRSLLLVAPSIIIGREPNVMINPAHPQATVLQTRIEEEVRWDSRLFSSGPVL